MSNEELRSRVLDCIRGLSVDDLITLNNNYVERNYYDGYVYELSEYCWNEFMSEYSSWDIINKLASDFSVRDKWFYMDSAGKLHSFKDAEDFLERHCEPEKYADAIIRDNEAYGISSIQDILDEAEEEEE